MTPFEEIAVWEVPPGTTGAEQMALDETMLRLAATPTLRVYRWARAEVTFGYPQRLADARTFAGNRPVTRRCTGGGFVEHGSDVTVALAVPATHAFRTLAPSEIYRRLHAAISAAPGLRLVGAEDAITGPACFTAPVTGDVMDGGGKVLGGALRRSRDGVLYQGSWRGDAEMNFAVAWGRRIVPVTFAGWEELRDMLVRERYGSAKWTGRR